MWWQRRREWRGDSDEKTGGGDPVESGKNERATVKRADTPHPERRGRRQGEDKTQSKGGGQARLVLKFVLLPGPLKL